MALRSEDALAQPTRARLFRLLADLGRPTGTDELAAELDLHPNGVRVHLERLHAAGLLVRDRPHTMRGRPRDMWSVAPGAADSTRRADTYEQLALWLLLALPSAGRTVGSVERTGRAIGRQLAPAAGNEPEAALHATLSEMGFAPRRETTSGARVSYRLGSCPYRVAVRDSPEIVCSLHRGITRGLLDALAPATRLTGFVPADPDRAGCLIELQGGLARPREESGAPR